MQPPISEFPFEGLMLWEIHFKSSYYDNDSRMPGTVPVDKRFFVLAKKPNEALKKVEPQLVALRQKYRDKEQITVNFIILESLTPARDASDDGRLGYISMAKLAKVELSLEEDKKHYRLGVCLIPIEE